MSVQALGIEAAAPGNIHGIDHSVACSASITACCTTLTGRSDCSTKLTWRTMGQSVVRDVLLAAQPTRKFVTVEQLAA